MRASTAKSRHLKFEPLESRQLLSAASLNPVADTFTRSGVNAGSATVLDVLDANGSGDRMAYVRFDLSSLNIDTITSATLSFYKTAGSRNDTITTGRFDVYGLTNASGATPQNWDEYSLAETGLGAEYTNTSGNGLDTSLLFNLDQESGASVIETVVNANDTAQSITGTDLVAFLNSRVDDGGLATFITYVDAGANRGWGYSSRENANPDVRPVLTLQYDVAVPPPEPVLAARQVEALDRGVIALRRSSTEVYLGWRMLGTDPTDVAFNVYRSSAGGTPVKLNAAPITQSTNYVDSTAPMTQENSYFVRPVIAGIELAASESYSLPAFATIQQHLDIPLQIPDGGTTPLGDSYTYTANDASVGDVDGDGQYEIILKWDPTNSKDNSQSGYTGNVYLDAYKLDGTLLWRIDLGVNIRAGAHYTQFMVFDLDGDGKAEVACKTAEGTRDGQGNYIANDPAKFTGTFPTGVDNNSDHRNSGGYILTGYEFLTVFSGETGAELTTTYYSPPRNSDITSSDVSAWGDNYGNRVDRFLACVAYLDGVHPSLVMCRGYYTRTVLAAYDWRDGQLTKRWTFDSNYRGNEAYAGQGTHSLSVADVDGDGKDEIIYGACTIDDDGTGLYTTGLGHGDALHVSDMIPSNPGLEVFQVHEGSASNGNVGASIRDAATGEILFSIYGNGDIGRGVAGDIDPNYPGYEFWATTADPVDGKTYVYGADGQKIYEVGNVFNNFLVWWDADITRELLDGTTIANWNPGRSNIVWYGASGINNNSGLSSNNSTKSTPTLSADILGDWREEVIWRTSDNTALQIWSTSITATTRMPTLMHDTQYRAAIAWQNVAYNQPPHPSFSLGTGVVPVPNVYSVSANPTLAGDFDLDGDVDAADLSIWQTTYGMTQSHGYLPGDGDGDGDVDAADYLIWQRNFGQSTPMVASLVASTESQQLAVQAEAQDAALASLVGLSLADPMPATLAVTQIDLENGALLPSTESQDHRELDRVFDSFTKPRMGVVP